MNYMLPFNFCNAYLNFAVCKALAHEASFRCTEHPGCFSVPCPASADSSMASETKTCQNVWVRCRKAEITLGQKRRGNPLLTSPRPTKCNTGAFLKLSLLFISKQCTNAVSVLRGSLWRQCLLWTINFQVIHFNLLVTTEKGGYSV